MSWSVQQHFSNIEWWHPIVPNYSERLRDPRQHRDEHLSKSSATLDRDAHLVFVAATSTSDQRFALTPRGIRGERRPEELPAVHAQARVVHDRLASRLGVPSLRSPMCRSTNSPRELSRRTQLASVDERLQNAHWHRSYRTHGTSRTFLPEASFLTIGLACALVSAHSLHPKLVGPVGIEPATKGL